MGNSALAYFLPVKTCKSQCDFCRMRLLQPVIGSGSTRSLKSTRPGQRGSVLAVEWELIYLNSHNDQMGSSSPYCFLRALLSPELLTCSGFFGDLMCMLEFCIPWEYKWHLVSAGEGDRGEGLAKGQFVSVVLRGGSDVALGAPYATLRASRVPSHLPAECTQLLATR